MLHCCPANYHCNTTVNGCKKNTSSVPWSQMRINESHVNDSYSNSSPKTIICADGKTQCPDGSTCCPLVTAGYGCCPTPEAVCCSDKIHCCPHQYYCDPNSDKCSRGNSIIPKFTKLPALPPLSQVLCPDDSTECNLNHTCCEISSNVWDCCPLPKAVCCDGGYCCSEGYTCDTRNMTCKKENGSIPIQNHVGMKILPGIEHNIVNNLIGASFNVCPDTKSECKDDQTCCVLNSGEWGCCQGTESVCCPDMIHCCPKNYKCESGGTCIQYPNRLDKDLL